MHFLEQGPAQVDTSGDCLWTVSFANMNTDHSVRPPIQFSEQLLILSSYRLELQMNLSILYRHIHDLPSEVYWLPIVVGVFQPQGTQFAQGTRLNFVKNAEWILLVSSSSHSSCWPHHDLGCCWSSHACPFGSHSWTPFESSPLPSFVVPLLFGPFNNSFIFGSIPPLVVKSGYISNPASPLWNLSWLMPSLTAISRAMLPLLVTSSRWGRIIRRHWSAMPWTLTCCLFRLFSFLFSGSFLYSLVFLSGFWLLFLPAQILWFLVTLSPVFWALGFSPLATSASLLSLS